MNATKILMLFATVALPLTSGCIIDDNDCYDCGSGSHEYPDPTPTPDPGPQYELISMYATGAQASSDGMPGSVDFSALQATGAPDVEACVDDPNAWSPEVAEVTPGVTPDGDTIDEWIELTFPEAVWVTQVKIFESLNPGAIVAVDLESSTGSAPVTVLWENFSGDGPAPCPSAFVIDLDGYTDYRYDRVVIYLDTNLVGDANQNGTASDDFNSIDAVMLSGDVPL